MSRTRFLGRFRSTVFVLPGIQSRLVLWFACTTLLALVLQFLQFTSLLGDALEEPVRDAAELHQRIAGGYVRSFLRSLAVVLPLTLAAGLLASFRVAGPLHRITRYLRAVRRGEAAEDCVLRRGDELAELCSLVNDVTRERRAEARVRRDAA